LLPAAMMSGSVALSFLASSQRLDAAGTPSYLLPFYMKSLQSRFTHFATAKGGQGEPAMTPTDFVNSLIGKPGQVSVSGVAEDLRKLFLELDANGDGLLNFGEYAILLTFLSNSRSDFDFAFRMFDVDGNMRLSFTEYKQLVRALCVNTEALTSPSFDSPLSNRFFGPDRTGNLTFSEFWAFVQNLRAKVWTSEFLNASGGKSTITAEEYFTMLCQSQLGSHLPFKLVATQRRLQKLGSSKAVSLEQYLRLCHVLSETDKLTRIISLYTDGGLSLKPVDFMRAIRAAKVGLDGHKNCDLTQNDVDLIYLVFDLNQDGSINMDEFMSVMGPKTTFNTPRKSIGSKVSWPVAFYECIREKT